MAVKIRDAVEDDIPALLAMARDLHAESPRYARLSFSVAKVEALIRSLLSSTLASAPIGGVFVAEKAGKIVGMLGAYVHAPYFSEDKIASDYTLYIVPEQRRRGRAAIGLVRAMEKWAWDNGAVDIVPGTSTMIDAESTAHFYEKLGYAKYGYTFIKRLR